MKISRLRVSIRTMIALVAGAALLIWGWMAYLNPVRKWQAAIRETSEPDAFWEAVSQASSGKIWGIDAGWAVAEFARIIGDSRENARTRAMAMGALPSFKAKAEPAIPVLIAALAHGDSPGIRSGAAVTIRQILGDYPQDNPSTKAAVAALTAALKDPNREVRRWSACCLAWVGHGDDAVPALIECCKEPDLDYDEQLKLLNALSRSGPTAKAAVPAIVAMMKVDSIDEGNRGGEHGRRGHAEAQIQAAKFLQFFGETGSAAAILRPLANDRDPLIAKQAAKVLASIVPAKWSEKGDGSQ